MTEMMELVDKSMLSRDFFFFQFDKKCKPTYPRNSKNQKHKKCEENDTKVHQNLN